MTVKITMFMIILMWCGVWCDDDDDDEEEEEDDEDDSEHYDVDDNFNVVCYTLYMFYQAINYCFMFLRYSHVSSLACWHGLCLLLCFICAPAQRSPQTRSPVVFEKSERP